MRGGAGLAKAVVAAAGVVALGLVAGCSGGDEAPPDGSGTTSVGSATPSSSSSTPTQSTTSTAAPEVQVPAAATKRTAAGAEAFARFYFESVGDAYVTGETQLIERLADDTCMGCAGFVRSIATRASKGQRAAKSSLEIKLVQTISSAAEQSVVSVAGREVPVQLLNRSGQVISTSQPGVFTANTSLTWRQGSWHIAKFEAM